MLEKELERIRYDVIDLSEVRWTGTGEALHGRLIYTGEQNKHAKGVGIVMSERAKRALISYNPISPRVIVARFRGRPFDLAVLQAYAPTADSTDDDLEEFYEQVEEGLRYMKPRDIRVVTGDWNAKIGEDNKGWEHIMGKHGIGGMNDRGERLLQFA